MTRHEIRLEHGRWSVTCFIGYHADADTDEISRALEGMGCTGEALLEARRHLAKDSEDRGLLFIFYYQTTMWYGKGKKEVSHTSLKIVGSNCRRNRTPPPFCIA